MKRKLFLPGLLILVSVTLLFACQKNETKITPVTEEELATTISRDIDFIEVYDQSIRFRDFFFSIRKSFNPDISGAEASRILSNIGNSEELKRNIKLITNSDEAYTQCIDFAVKQQKLLNKYQESLSRFTNKSDILSKAYFLVKSQKSKKEELANQLWDCKTICGNTFIISGNRCQNTLGYSTLACATLSGNPLVAAGCIIIANLQYNNCVDDALSDLAQCVKNCSAGGGGGGTSVN